MNRSISLIRISQLPLALFGIIHVEAVNGIRLSKFAYTNMKIRCEDSPALT